MARTDVTVVVVPRERFSLALASLESILGNTEPPFELLYIDGHSPAHVSAALQDRADQHGFRLIRSDGFLSPNAARNLALPHVSTPYLVFIDNDVIVRPGWLQALIRCAERHDATAVCPLTFEDAAFRIVHQAGGTLEWKPRGDGQRWLTERRPWNHLPLARVSQPLVAGPTELNEFHGVLVRTDLFERIGLLDEALLSMAEETDFSISLARSGGRMFFEPRSQVSYIPPTPETLQPSDLPYFRLRWSNNWARASVDHMARKHALSPCSPVLTHWLRFVYQHRQFCATGSRRLPARQILFGAYAATLSRREKLDRLLEHLSDPTARA